MRPFTTQERLLAELEDAIVSGGFQPADTANLRDAITHIGAQDYHDGHWRVRDDDGELSLNLYDVQMMLDTSIVFAGGKVALHCCTFGCGTCIDYEGRDEPQQFHSLDTEPRPYCVEAVRMLMSRAHDFRVAEYKEHFCILLRLTRRKNIDRVLHELDEMGFFTAPASREGHNNFKGGLVIHSVRVYLLATEMAHKVVGLAEGIENSEERMRKNDIFGTSIEIAALLHDVCKAQRYTLCDDGTYKKRYGSVIGHGEGSVIMLLNMGLELTHDEQMAIRYHMGGYDVSPSAEAQMDLRTAMCTVPLVSIVQAADTLSSSCLE